MTDKDTCASCWYYRARNQQVLEGACHRYPETTQVQAKHWCGDYRSRVSMEMQPLSRPKEGEA